MLRVELYGELDEEQGIVWLGQIPYAIWLAKSGGEIGDPMDPRTERDVVTSIVAAIRRGQLVALDPDSLLPLPEYEFQNAVVILEQLREWGHATGLYDFVPGTFGVVVEQAAPAAAEHAPDTANNTTSKAHDGPPALTKGLVTISRLAIKAAWEIERENKRKASAKEVIKRLQDWATANRYAELIAVIPHGVTWMTTALEEKRYDVDACSAMLKSWHKRRA